MVSVSDFGTTEPGSIPVWVLITFFFFVMQNYFLQIMWNYINSNNYTPERFILSHLRNFGVGDGVRFGPPEI